MITETQEPPFFSAVENIRYSKADKSQIDCDVTLASNNQKHPYTSVPNDSTVHGAELWKDLIAGKYGDINPYSEPKITKGMLIAQAQAQIELCDRVASRCYKASIPFPPEWQVYDDALRTVISSGKGSIPKQPDYPSNT